MDHGSTIPEPSGSLQNFALRNYDRTQTQWAHVLATLPNNHCSIFSLLFPQEDRNHTVITERSSRGTLRKPC
uniref:Uncharacterized protein n=1 Tax=Anguilla anguilla TaxID=7936 RepID=A0A0E9UQ55_ANGAN